jgi:hypothetical protein
MLSGMPGEGQDQGMTADSCESGSHMCTHTKLDWSKE